jgi:hypothetical protein
MSILHFVEQYQKIQDKIHVVEDGGDLKQMIKTEGDGRDFL